MRAIGPLHLANTGATEAKSSLQAALPHFLLPPAIASLAKMAQAVSAMTTVEVANGREVRRTSGALEPRSAWPLAQMHARIAALGG